MHSKSYDDYCVNVCGGLCCRWHKRCPELMDDGSCGIYDKWRDGWCHYNHNGLKAMPIKRAIDQNKIPDYVKSKCCYYDERVLCQ